MSCGQRPIFFLIYIFNCCGWGHIFFFLSSSWCFVERRAAACFIYLYIAFNKKNGTQHIQKVVCFRFFFFHCWHHHHPHHIGRMISGVCVFVWLIFYVRCVVMMCVVFWGHISKRWRWCEYIRLECFHIRYFISYSIRRSFHGLIIGMFTARLLSIYLSHRFVCDELTSIRCYCSQNIPQLNNRNNNQI